MVALVIGLRTSRMLVWGLLTSVASVVIALLMWDVWFDSLADVSVWSVLPLAYTGALIVAGAADTERIRRTTSLDDLITLSGRPRWQRHYPHVLPVILYGAVLPVALPTAVIAGAAQFGTRTGVLTLTYALAALLFAFGASVLGTVIGALVASRIGSLILALVFGLGLSLFANPVPPSNYSWVEINPVRVGGLVGIVGAFLFALVLACGLRRRRGQVLAKSMSVLALMAGLLAGYLLAGVPSQREKVADHAGVCDHSGEFPVCVWPGDEHYLPPIVSMTERFDRLNEQMGGPAQWTVAEAGLVAQEPVVRIEPLGSGEGLWFVAESFAFALLNALPVPDCDYSAMSPAELEEMHVQNWSVAESMTNFVFGDGQPTSIRTSAPELDRQVKEIVDVIDTLPPPAQLEWIEERWQANQEC